MGNNKKNLIFSRSFKLHASHVAIFVAAGFFVVWMGWLLLASPLSVAKEVQVTEGQGLYVIADNLKNSGVINSEFVFVAYTLITGNEKKLQAGRYLFKPGVTIPVIVHSMAEGFAESDDIVLTIPEGFNVFDIDERLSAFGLIKKGEFAIKYHTDEGQFFPDTYRFDRGACSVEREACVDEIAQKMKNHLNLRFEDLSLVLSSLVLRDTLTRASILEKEARKEEDMRLVAGVIENRLAKGMLLQIDATVSYGACLRRSIADNFSRYCDVSQVPVGAEIRVDGPYNSYKRAGLPAGPIANPGIQAIQAILNPQKSDYLYYLSTRDGSQLIFSKTASEHATNRRKHLGI